MRRAFLTLVAFLCGCTGQIDDPGSDDDDLTPAETAALCQTSGISVAKAPLRHLTRDQYDNTVRDLLGDTSAPARSFPPDERAGHFVAGLAVSPLLADKYVETAAALATRAMSRLDQLLGCERDDTCAYRFIESFGRKAYRRPLEPAEITELTTFFDAAKAAHGFDTAMRMLIERFLASPFFVYRVESGQAGSPRPLSGYETASRLSYFLWGTMPDADLFARAAAGDLDSAAGVEAATRAMLDDPKARPMVRDFIGQWLGLSRLDEAAKDPAFYPQFDEQLRDAMRAETERFVDYVLFEGDAKLATLLSASYSFVDSRLAELYGSAPVAGSELKLRNFDPSQRAGLLTHASVLTMLAKSNQTSPIHRGQFVRERLLCQALPPPPPNVAAEVPSPDPNSTARQRFAAHTENASCAACHQLMDPIGFGFESYDGIGRYRTHDGTHPVDASGEVVAGEDVSGTFNGAVELAHKLAASKHVEACFAEQWMHYALGRGDREDACSSAKVNASFAASGGDLEQLIVAITTSDAFRFLAATEAP